jgi:troponin T, fast skeletal muscle
LNAEIGQNTLRAFFLPQFNLSNAQIERSKTKEQLEEEKKISLTFRIKPLELHGMGVTKLRLKATELWDAIVKLETEKYDLEERMKRQDYDVSNFHQKIGFSNS